MYLSNVAALDGDIDRRVARSVAMTRYRKLSSTARSSVDAPETPQRRTRASIIWMVQTVRHSSALSLPCPALPKLDGGRSIHDGRVTFTMSSRTCCGIANLARLEWRYICATPRSLRHCRSTARLCRAGQGDKLPIIQLLHAQGCPSLRFLRASFLRAGQRQCFLRGCRLAECKGRALGS